MLAFLIGLVVLGGVASQSLMDTATVFIFLFFLKDLYQKKTSLSEIKPLGIEWAFIGYFLVAVVSLALNGKPPVPWFEYLSKFNWILNLYLLIYAFNKIDLNHKKWLNYFALAFLIPNLYAVATHITRYDYLTKQALTGGIIGVVNSATYHAHGNSLIFVFFTAFFIFCYKILSEQQKIFLTSAVLLMGASTFLSFTRGIWGATFVSLLILFLLQNKKYALYFVAICFFGLILSVSFSDLIRLRIINTFTGHNDYIRLELIQVHLLMFKTHPWFGIGFWDSYRQIADYWPQLGKAPDHFESHAHNQIVNVLATTGLFGAFFFAAITCFFVKKAVAFYKSSKSTIQMHALSVACLILLIQFFLACITDVTFEYAKIRGILVVGLAALISFKTRESKVI